MGCCAFQFCNGDDSPPYGAYGPAADSPGRKTADYREEKRNHRLSSHDASRNRQTTCRPSRFRRLPRWQQFRRSRSTSLTICLGIRTVPRGRRSRRSKRADDNETPARVSRRTRECKGASAADRWKQEARDARRRLRKRGDRRARPVIERGGEKIEKKSVREGKIRQAAKSPLPIKPANSASALLPQR